VSQNNPIQDKTQPKAKRAFDVVFAALGLAVLSPMLAVLAGIVKLSDGGPVLYRQRRVGLGGQVFEIWKFRSMVVGAERMGPAVTGEGDKRITWIGKIMRGLKLDELPQLWNVLKGEMSFVGPRPEVPRYVEAYTAAQREILNFKPGITDLATLRFREEESLLREAANVEEFYVNYCVPRKIALNLEYAEQANLFRDVSIIVQTVCPYSVRVLMLYAAVLTASLWMSWLLRFDFAASATQPWLKSLVWMAPLQLVCLAWRRQAQSLLSYFDLPELRETAVALSAATVLQIAVNAILPEVWRAPVSVTVFNFIFAGVLLSAIRLAARMAREKSEHSAGVADARTLRVGIVGANQEGAALARSFMQKMNPRVSVTCFFDDDASKWHKYLHNVPIVGMPELLKTDGWSKNLDEVVLALPGAPAFRQEAIARIISQAKLKGCANTPLSPLPAGNVAE
jgi:lipopolysaccharide/colanic/teichoic acid biosynthesis glycosyltransferase